MNDADMSHEMGGFSDDPELERFIVKVAMDDDDLSVVVRTQTWIEYFLEKLIRAYFTDPEAETNWFEVEYMKRVKLALLLGALPDCYSKPLTLLAHLRNLFAHNPHTRIDDKSVEKLYCSLTGPLKEHIDNQAPPSTYNSNLSDAQTKLRAVANTLNNMMYWAYRFRKAQDRDLALASVAKPNAAQLHYHIGEYKP